MGEAVTTLRCPTCEFCVSGILGTDTVFNYLTHACKPTEIEFIRTDIDELRKENAVLKKQLEIAKEALEDFRDDARDDPDSDELPDRASEALQQIEALEKEGVK